ncbi:MULTISPECIES: NUDIX hydrolase [Paenibacillus]|uniref:NUDIX hydrolase n=1 Tax=Paenibacillus TaxID=44249 RepID=UPI000364B127|nr:NUDIX domain-containing protein [Paenibacillus massiliensis]
MSAFIDKIAWIHIEGRRVLGARSQGKEIFYLPGGKRDPGETDAEALIREIQEELSVHIVPATVALVGTFEAEAHGKSGGTPVRMTCYTAEYTGELQPDSEIAELSWLQYADRDRVSPASQLILEQLHASGQID